MIEEKAMEIMKKKRDKLGASDGDRGFDRGVQVYCVEDLRHFHFLPEDGNFGGGIGKKWER
jgi:hypothetical protein